MATITVTKPATSRNTTDTFEDCTAHVVDGGALEIQQTPRYASDPANVDYVVRKRYSPIGWLECETK